MLWPLFSYHKSGCLLFTLLSTRVIHLQNANHPTPPLFMDSSWPENLPVDRKKVTEKIVRGRDFAKQLQILLSKPQIQDGLASVEDLVAKILRSFTETLSILNCGDSDEVSRIPEKRSPCWDGQKSEDSGESSKSSTLKDRRGCYKRRKTSQSWTRVTPNLIDDGHAWRKYGQKVILNAKHPRNYFRCTHKHDQGCQATKQVQKTEEDPPMYRITYNGYHTCQNLLKAPRIILDSTHRDSSVLLSFDANIPEKQDYPFFTSSFPLIKQEYKEDIPSDDMTHHQNQSSSSDYLLSPDLTTFDSSGPMTGLSSTLGSDHGDVISGMNSCTESTHSLDMDIMVGSVDLDDVLGFF